MVSVLAIKAYRIVELERHAFLIVFTILTWAALYDPYSPVVLIPEEQEPLRIE
jgi:hypothetical protein